MDGIRGTTREFKEWLLERLDNRQIIVQLEMWDAEKLNECLADMTQYETGNGLTIFHICIDVRAPLLVVVVHELLHLRFPDATEEQIEDLTTMVLERLSIPDYVEILQGLAGAVLKQ